MKEMKQLKNVHFERKYKPFKYNKIKTIDYPSSERGFLRHNSCTSNIIGEDNDKIVGIFCYDAK